MIIKKTILSIILLIAITVPVFPDDISTLVTENTEILIPQIRFHQASKSASFCFVTDLHNVAYGAVYNENNSIIQVIRRIIQGVNIINDSVNISAIVAGGDYLSNDSETPQPLAVRALEGVTKAMHDVKQMPVLFLKGNHDDNSMGYITNMLSPEIFYKNGPESFQRDDVVTDLDNPFGCYGYYDIKPQKIRIIYLNSVDIPWIEKGVSLKYKGQNTCGVQQAQLDFVAKALHFDEGGWGVVFVSHHGITPIQGFNTKSTSHHIPANNGGSQLMGIIKAFKDKTTYSGTIKGDFASVVNVDFTDNPSQEVICLISGHTHADRNAVMDDMLFLSTTTATQSSTGLNTDGSKNVPIANTKDEGAADFITIDRNNGIIYLDRYGYGVSRKFYYKGNVGKPINKSGLIYMVDGKVHRFYDIECGAKIIPDDAPTKEGYTFSGWSDIPETMPGHDVTVSGTFSINKYKLTYMVDGIEYKSYEVEYGATVSPEATPMKEGCTFSGWSEIPETMPSENVTITGTFSINKYILTYVVDGEVYNVYSYDYGSEITPEAEPTKEGYTFSGWSGIPERMPANQIYVVGTFSINKYKVTYIIDGEVFKTEEMEYGAKIFPEATPMKEGCTFSGWSEIPNNMPANDVIVTGYFTRKAVVIGDVTYELDGDSVVIGKSENAKGDVIIESSVEIDGQDYIVTAIGQEAFQRCIGLTSVEIPSSVNAIYEDAFEGCANLLLIKMGCSVRDIGIRSFANIAMNNVRTREGDEGLHVFCEAESIPKVDASTFEGTLIDKAILHVVDDLVGAYKMLSPWNEFGTIVGMTDDISSISAITPDSTSVRIYDMQGIRLNNVRKGVNIIQEKSEKDGRPMKIIVK